MSIPQLFDLSGRTAIVTGAGSEHGIGFATARLLVDLGATVVLTSTSSRINERVEELGSERAVGVVGDLTEIGTAP